jgi:hypothetical protein
MKKIKEHEITKLRKEGLGNSEFEKLDFIPWEKEFEKVKDFNSKESPDFFASNCFDLVRFIV